MKKYYNKKQESLFKKTFGVSINAFAEPISTQTSGKFAFDISKFDEFLGKVDKEYDSTNCTYKTLTDLSMSDYLTIKYGKEIEGLICDLIDQKF